MCLGRRLVSGCFSRSVVGRGRHAAPGLAAPCEVHADAEKNTAPAGAVCSSDALGSAPVTPVAVAPAPATPVVMAIPVADNTDGDAWRRVAVAVTRRTVGAVIRVADVRGASRQRQGRQRGQGKKKRFHGEPPGCWIPAPSLR